MTSVTVNTYTHSVTYVADNILKSLKDIILLSGLDPSALANTRESKMRALKAWLESRDLEKVVLEIYHPTTGALITRWDIEITYGWSADAAGSFYTDTEQLKYAIRKAGVAPSEAKYTIILCHKYGAPAVDGWIATEFRSTNNMVRQPLGSTIEHSGLGANTTYWRQQ